MTVQIKTQDKIYNDLLSHISKDYEKSPGFLTADLSKSNAIELSKIYTVIQSLMDMVNVDNLVGDELARYVKQRKGIIKKEATYAKVMLNITGDTSIIAGYVFATSNNTQFKSLENKTISGSGSFNAQALIAGSSGMVGANTIISMPITIPGVISVTNESPSYDGFDAESDESLRQRYYEALQKPATSGNIYQYLVWAKSVSGVGNAKVIPLWNGANTVKVTIIDANMQPATTSLIDTVQNYIDPMGESNSTWGTGAGEAPIGAYCTVVSATALDIDVSVDIVLSAGGYTESIVLENIRNNLTEYLKSIAFEQDYVSYAKVGNVILETEGVKDYTTLTINGGTTSVTIEEGQVAVLGNVVIS